MDLIFNCASVNASGNNNRTIEVEITGADLNDILSSVHIKEIYDFYGGQNILDFIGADRCKEYFDLIDNPE